MFYEGAIAPLLIGVGKTPYTVTEEKRVVWRSGIRSFICATITAVAFRCYAGR